MNADRVLEHENEANEFNIWQGIEWYKVNREATLFYNWLPALSYAKAGRHGGARAWEKYVQGRPLFPPSFHALSLRSSIRK